MISIFCKGAQGATYRGDIGISGSDNIGLCYGPQLLADAVVNADRFKNPIFSKEYARDKWPKRYLTHIKHEGALQLWQGENGFEDFEAVPYYNGYVAYRKTVGIGEYAYLLDPRGNGLSLHESWPFGDTMTYRQYIDPKTGITYVAVAYAPDRVWNGRQPQTWCYLAAHAFKVTFDEDSRSFRGAFGVLTATGPTPQPPSEAVFNDLTEEPISWTSTETDGYQYGMWQVNSHLSNAQEEIDMKTLARNIDRYVNMAIPNVDAAFDSSVFIDAIRNFRPGTTNLGEFTVGLKELPLQAREILRKTSRVSLLVIADLYLSWCYGLRPLPDDVATVRQLGSIIAKFKRQFSDETIAGRKNIEFQEFSGHECLKIKLHEPVNTPIEDRIIPDDGSMLRAGRLIGLASPITGGAIRNALADSSIPVDVWGLARNVWELLPFSFVFDWFNNVSHKLKFSEDLAYARRAPIKFIEQSIKMYRSALPADIMRLISGSIPESFDWSFNVSTSVYDRTYRRNLPTYVAYQPLKSGNFTHWFEAGALLSTCFLGRR